MDNKKFYRVFCETKHGRHGYLTSYFVDVLAANLNDAKEIATARWYKYSCRHPFHMKCLRLLDVVLAESFTEVKKEPDAIKWFESREINVF